MKKKKRLFFVFCRTLVPTKERNLLGRKGKFERRERGVITRADLSRGVAYGGRKTSMGQREKSFGLIDLFLA